jgi:hypothetical protein
MTTFAPFVASAGMFAAGILGLAAQDPLGAMTGLGGSALSIYVIFELRSLRRDVTVLQGKRK